jgi:excisionase family DNA binding protein
MNLYMRTDQEMTSTCSAESPLTTRDVATRLGVTPGTITRWTKQGLLPSVRVGKRYRYEPAAVDSLAAGKEQERLAQERRRQLLTTPDAAAALGINPAQFRRFAGRPDLQPEAWYQHPYDPCGPDCPLWPPEAVRDLADHPEVVAMREARRRRQAGRE